MFENTLLPMVLRCGISIFEYWELTIGEMYSILEAYNALIEYNRQRDYALATMISGFVGCSLSGKEIPSYNSLYQLEDEKEDNSAVMLYMELWKDFAERRNKLLKELNNDS